MKVKFHYSLIGIFIIFLFTGLYWELFIFLGVIMAHEMGHMLVCLLVRQKVRSLNITMVGGILDVQIQKVSFFKELLIYIAGVLVNIIFLFSSRYITNDYYRQLIYNYNLLIIGFNLLPIYPLDGFKIIELFMGLINNPFVEHRILSIFSHLCLVSITVLCVLYTNSLAFWVILVYLYYQNMIYSSHRNDIALKNIVRRYHYKARV